MLRNKSQSIAVVTGVGLALLAALPAFADDLEIFRATSQVSGVSPNVLFVMDSSGSMSTLVNSPRPPYDPTVTYSGSCNSGNIYYVAGASVPATPPRCTGGAAAASFNANANTCAAMKTAFANAGSFYQDVAAQYRSVSGTNRWRTLSTSSDLVECKADNGVDGQARGDGRPYIQEDPANGWTAAAGNAWDVTGGSGSTAFNTATSYIFYTANYLNWANQPPSVFQETRLEIIQRVAKSLAGSLSNVNIGLMRYNDPIGGPPQGGSVLQAIGDVSTNLASFDTAVDSIRANGNTPLTSTLYEAYRYYSGQGVVYGNHSPGSVAASRVGNTLANNNYQSPIKYECQKNYIIYMTDGLPTTDTLANSAIQTLVGHSCGTPPGPASDGGQCMDDLAGYMADQQNVDLAPDPTLSGNQNVFTYMIGFGDDPQLATTGTPYLNAVAAAGGTQHSYTAADADALTATLQQIFTTIQQTSSTFVTPAISVNAFNRAQTQNDLFFSVFKPDLGLHWPGNLKKYQLGVDGSGNTAILDANNQLAVAPTGFFSGTSQSIWSKEVDGPDVTMGGTAERIDHPATRNLYTDVSGNPLLSDPSNTLDAPNLNVSDAMLGITLLQPLPARGTIIGWARGFDVDDVNGNGITLEPVPTPFMGDPLHGKPAIVNYGGAPGSPDATDVVVYVPSNDGFLHAFNGRTDTAKGGGSELWAFVPKELLYRLKQLYLDPDTVNRTYGLDGDVQVLKYDANNNGVVDPGDKVWLFFGMRMGQDQNGVSYYYGLDVTDRNNPKLMWTLGSAQLPGLGQTWSPPQITRVNVGPNGSQNDNAHKFVLIFGGGYDMSAETPTNTTETVGNGLYMVDAESGKLLWRAGPASGPGAGGNLQLAQMTNAIPGAITVIDTDGDQFADRMYAADLGGRIWRFDIFNGNPSGTLVTGGAIALLGAGSTGAGQPDNRRFYNAPDVALVQSRAVPSYYSISIGSGYRGHPLDSTTVDNFYSVRDKQPFAHWTQAMYNAYTPVLDAGLVDITSNPGGIAVPLSAPGWKLTMNLNGKGEKILTSSTTVNNVIFFNSFQPGAASGSSACIPTNQNRTYAVSILNGKPALDFNDDGVVDKKDLSINLRQQGIVGDVNVAFLQNQDKNGNPVPGTSSVCLAGVQVLSRCVGGGGVIRTFWDRTDAQ